MTRHPHRRPAHDRPTIPPDHDRRDDDARLLKKIHAIRPVLVERARIAAAGPATPVHTS